MPLQPIAASIFVQAAIVPHFVRAAIVPCVMLQALCGMVLIFGVANRVLYRMALVPMRDHVFFLAQVGTQGGSIDLNHPASTLHPPRFKFKCMQLQNVGYLLVYFSLLALRIRWAARGPECAGSRGAMGWLGFSDQVGGALQRSVTMQQHSTC